MDRLSASECGHAAPSLCCTFSRIGILALQLAELAQKQDDGDLARLATDAAQITYDIHAVQELLASVAGVER
jgi:hypothetical protein